MPGSPWSGYAGPGNLRIFGKSNEKYHVRGGNDQIPARSPTRRRADHPQRPLTAIKGTRTAPTAHLQAGQPARPDGRGRPGRAGDPVLGPALVGRLLAAASRRSSGRRSTSWAWAPTPSCTSSSASRYWNASAATATPTPTRGYQNTWEVTRAQAGASGILVDYTGGTIGASFGSGTPTRAPAVPGADRARAARASPRSGTAGRRSTTGPATRGRRAPTATGRSASTRSSPGPSASGGQLPLRRRAHLDRLPGLPQRRRGDRRARRRRDHRRPRLRAPEPGDGQPGP